MILSTCRRDEFHDPPSRQACHAPLARVAWPDGPMAPIFHRIANPTAARTVIRLRVCAATHGPR